MTCPEMAVPNAFIGGSFWNNSAFPSSTDPTPTPASPQYNGSLQVLLYNQASGVGHGGSGSGCRVGPGLVYP